MQKGSNLLKDLSAKAKEHVKTNKTKNLKETNIEILLSEIQLDIKDVEIRFTKEISNLENRFTKEINNLKNDLTKDFIAEIVKNHISTLRWMIGLFFGNLIIIIGMLVPIFMKIF